MKRAHLLVLLGIAGVSAINGDSNVVAVSDPRLHWFGRKILNGSSARLDWTGVGFSLRVSNDSSQGTVSIEIDGEGERFAVYTGLSLTKDFFATKRSVYALATVEPGDMITLVKTTESKVVELSAVQLSSGVKIAPFGLPPSRRIEFWGDSDTAAFGVDATRWNILGCALNPNKYENFDHGWVHGVMRALGAEAQVQAISGIGVVKNAGGEGITLPKLVKRSLHNIAQDDYNASAWRPDIVAVYVGSNDWVNAAPPSESDFKEAYTAMIKNIVASYRSVPVLHICGLESTPCGYIKAMAAAMGQHYTTTMDPSTTKLGCVEHRSAKQQAALAARLSPVIAKAAGWDVPSEPSFVV